MGAGFTRRYNFVPGQEVITLIEGIVILDLPPPGNITGVQTGVACLVGEFQDSTFGVLVTNSVVSQSPVPQQIFSGQDLLNKVGGFDPTIGDFGGTMGNGFVELRNKKFAQLVVIPVSIASSRAMRDFRKLPFNASSTSPTPVVPMQAASVPAGTAYLNGTQQVNSAGFSKFTGRQAYLSGVDGAITASAGATEMLNSASGLFVSGNVQVGDVVVLGAPLSTAVIGSWTGAAAILPTDAVITLQGGAQGFTSYPPTGLLAMPSGEQATYSGTTSSASGSAFTGVTRGVNGTVGATQAVGGLAIGINNVDTYRINAVAGTTALTLERQDRTNFSSSNSFGASMVPWRVHTFSDAESAAGIGANAAAYTVPARPLAASVPAATVMSPLTPAPAATFNSWNPLSGLSALTDPTTGLVFVAATQGLNPGPSATLDALYTTAIAASVGDNLPQSVVNLLWAARKSATIRSQLNQAANNQSAIGVGRVSVIAPDLQSVTSTAQAIATGDPGVGAIRNERVVYTWPAVQTFVPEAVNSSIKGADGNFYTNGIIDMPADGWLVSVMSNINPEWNPGQAGPPVPAVLAPVIGLARNMPVNLGINDYIAFKQNGVCAIRNDRSVGFVFQSGKTTALTSGQTDINRRRMADFIQDSISTSTASLAKLPMTLLLQDNIVTQIDSFLNGLLSPDNLPQQRINAYQVDSRSGNTPQLTQAGVFVVIVSVQTTPTADFIVYQFNIGNGVVIATPLG